MEPDRIMYGRKVKLKMDKVANSGNDEFYTPRYAIEPILKYVKKSATVVFMYVTICSQNR